MKSWSPISSPNSGEPRETTHDESPMEEQDSLESSDSADTSGMVPGWMATYGDMMSLLLTFFILLATFSSIELVKFQKAMGSLQGALGVLETDRGKHADFSDMTAYDKEKLLGSIYEVQAMVQDQGLAEDIEIEINEGFRIRIKGDVLFNLGDDTLNPSILPLMRRVAEVLKRIPSDVRVEGHTDDLPINSVKFSSNWDLSAARALSTLKYFVHVCDVPPERLSAVGYGQYRPRLPNSNMQNRAHNRRVEIHVKLPTELFPPGPKAHR